DELVALSLVDPDNRRPVDFALRRRLLDAVRNGGDDETADMRKLRLIVAALDLRRRMPEVFAGDYEPVGAGDGAIAYVRGGRVFVACSLFSAARPPPEPPGGNWSSVYAAPGISLFAR